MARDLVAAAGAAPTRAHRLTMLSLVSTVSAYQGARVVPQYGRIMMQAVDAPPAPAPVAAPAPPPAAKASAAPKAPEPEEPETVPLCAAALAARHARQQL